MTVRSQKPPVTDLAVSAEISASVGRIPCDRHSLMRSTRALGCRIQRLSSPARPLRMAPAEFVVFRATILTIVWLFAIGPSALPLCKAWCTPRATAETGCHHARSGGDASVGSADTCEDSLGPVGLLKEDLRRAPLPDAGPAVLMARLQVTATAMSPVAARPQGRPPSCLRQSHSTPLRI